MPTLTHPLSREDIDLARHAIGAHFTEAIADAETRHEPTTDLLAEAADWVTDHTLTEDRIRAILDHAPAGEKDAVRRYFEAGRP